MIDYSAIGNRIREARKSQGIIQAKLAELLSKSPEYISRLERGSTKISLPTLVEVAGLLNVSPSYLLDGATTADASFALAEFSQILAELSPDKRKLLLEIAKIVAKDL